MYQYVLCGLKVESDFAFPELTPWDGPADRPFDIEFRLGPVEQVWPPDEKGVKFQALGPDRIIFLVGGVGRILIENGRRVVFDAFPGAEEDRIRIEFIGTTQAMLWYQRGYLPLHASALLVDGRAIAIGAQRHSGKSVIAAALVKRGWPLVADDMLVVDTSGPVPMALPGYQKLRLWKDACEELGMMSDAIAEAWIVPGKYVCNTIAAPPHVPAPLTDMFILSGAREGNLEGERLGPVQGLQNLLAATHWLDAARASGRQEQIFVGLNALVSKVRLWRATAPQGLEHALAAADSIIELAKS